MFLATPLRVALIFSFTDTYVNISPPNYQGRVDRAEKAYGRDGKMFVLPTGLRV